MANLIHISETDLSDFYKSAHGFRPRGIYKEWWTEAELETEYHYLAKVCEENRIMEEAREHQALLDFNKLIEETIAYGAGDRETAIRWLVDGECLEFHAYDLEYFFWGHGLSYELQKQFTKELLKD
jgi:hypothetical protein